MSDALQHHMAALEAVLYATEDDRLSRMHLFCVRQQEMASPPSAAFWHALGNVVGQSLLDVRRFS